jgi:hypothetical protein
MHSRICEQDICDYVSIYVENYVSQRALKAPAKKARLPCAPGNARSLARPPFVVADGPQIERVRLSTGPPKVIHRAVETVDKLVRADALRRSRLPRERFDPLSGAAHKVPLWKTPHFV